MSRIATALEQFFSVFVLDGGPPTPTPDVPPTVSWRFLTPLYRGDGGEVRPLDDSINLETALAQRQRAIIEAVQEAEPTAFIVEFFPFARTMLAGEIEAGIRRLRELNPGGLIFSSIRDVPFSTLEVALNEFDTTRRDRFRFQVTDVLTRLGFDGIFAHTDANVISIKEYLPWLDSLPIPVIETGFVSSSAPRISPNERQGIVVSMGGGVDGYPLADAVLESWSKFRKEGIPSAYENLTIFGGTYLPGAAQRHLKQRCERAGVLWQPFSEEAREHVNRAALSISRAGYNTCVELFTNRTPAILSPTRASDQALRAEILAKGGMVLVAEDDKTSMYEAIRTALTFTPSLPDVRLDGAETTARHLIEMLRRCD